VKIMTTWRGLRVLLILQPIAASLVVTAQETSPRDTLSTRFELAGPSSYTDEETLALRERFEEVFDAVMERVGVSLAHPIMVVFRPPSSVPCASRGATMTPAPGSDDDFLPLIFIFADANTDREQISAVWAHELGHALQYSALEGGRSLGSMFLEGFATWAAGPYWLEWQGADSFESLIASYIAAGSYVPLRENDGFLDTISAEAAQRLGDACLAQRDIIYSEWAAFIDYLVEQHGKERLYSLFKTPPLVRDDDQARYLLPNFPAVYGSSLERLEAAWLAAITAAN
jgi:hypothetical protein